MIVGSKGGMRNCPVTFRENHPLFRLNLFFGLQVDSTLKYVAEEEELNIPQNNLNLQSFKGRILCKPGSSALVIGAGSGARSLGWLMWGARGCAGERPKQFQELTLARCA